MSVHPSAVKIPSKTAPTRELDAREMAMDALNNLNNHIPDWLKRLDDLSGKVDKRQAELAAIAVTDKAAEARSMRNKGSTESLKPQDDGPANIQDPIDVSAVPRIDEVPEEFTTTAPAPVSAAEPGAPTTQNTSEPPANSPETAALAQQAREAVLDSHARARQSGKKRQRPSSVISGDAATPAYRTRSMIIVYYDAYVQGFFDDLVRFISSSRNMVRKAKMAAKVAHIKKLAEMEVDADEEKSDDEMNIPSLRYMSGSRLGPMAGRLSRRGGADQAPDIYDKLDKGLESVQSTCEHGAHQFLRDADCNDEIKKIQSNLREVLAMAEKEAERVKREEPELAKETSDSGRARTRRPISMRREITPSRKDSPLSAKDAGPGNEKLEAKIPLPALTPDANAPLEVDSDEDGDEGIDIEPPALMFRSSRNMRR